jgi:hypothetical protein
LAEVVDFQPSFQMPGRYRGRTARRASVVVARLRSNAPFRFVPVEVEVPDPTLEFVPLVLRAEAAEVAARAKPPATKLIPMGAAMRHPLRLPRCTVIGAQA